MTKTLHVSRILVLLALAFSFSYCQRPLYKNLAQGSFIAVDEESPLDSALYAFVNPFKVQLEAEMGKVIGESVRQLDKSGAGETPLGNLIADFQKEYAEEFFGYPVDISIINNGGIRNVLPQGNITLGNVFEISPFDNYLFVLELSSQDIQSLAEYATKGKNLGITGMYIVAENNTVKEVLIAGKPVQANTTYLLAVNDYLASGGDNMGFLTNLKRKEESSILLRDILRVGISKRTARGEKIDASIEGRQIYK